MKNNTFKFFFVFVFPVWIGSTWIQYFKYFWSQTEKEDTYKYVANVICFILECVVLNHQMYNLFEKAYIVLKCLDKTVDLISIDWKDYQDTSSKEKEASSKGKETNSREKNTSSKEKFLKPKINIVDPESLKSVQELFQTFFNYKKIELVTMNIFFVFFLVIFFFQYKWVRVRIDSL